MKQAIKMSCFIFSLLALVFVGQGYSQESEVAKFPNRPLTFIVPLPAGSGGDVASRLLLKEAEKFLGQPVAVVNKPGGAYTIGVAAIAASKPDGYTIGYTTTGSIFLLPFFEKLPYHPLKDLQPIMQFCEMTFAVTVRSDSPFKQFKDIVAHARQNPKKVTYGTGGTHSLPNVTIERIARMEGVQFTHIPFKGGAEFQQALLGGHIDFSAGDFQVSLVEAGQTRILFLLAEDRRADYPGVPTLREIGYDIPYPALAPLMGPKGIPEGIVRKWDESLAKAMNEPAFRKGMKELRLPVIYRNSRDLEAYVFKTYQTFEKMLKEMNLTK
jgi:tripartite-type tricarboxylate transporter receptor subunit TctC